MKTDKLKNMDNVLMRAIRENSDFLGISVPGYLWYNVEKLQEKKQKFFVAFDRSEVQIIPVLSERDSAFFRIINERRFRRGGLWFVTYNREGKFVFNPVDRDTWKTVCKFIAPKREIVQDDREKFAKPTSAELMFRDAYDDNRYHKCSRRGFQKTFNAADKQRFMGSLIVLRP